MQTHGDWIIYFRTVIGTLKIKEDLKDFLQENENENTV